MELSDSDSDYDEDLFDNKKPTTMLQVEDDEDDEDEDIDEVLGLNPKKKTTSSKPVAKKKVVDEDSEEDGDDLLQSVGIGSRKVTQTGVKGEQEKKGKSLSREALMSEIYGSKARPGRKRKQESTSTAPPSRQKKVRSTDPDSTDDSLGHTTARQNEGATKQTSVTAGQTIVLSDSDEDDALNFEPMPVLDEHVFPSGEPYLPPAIAASLQVARESQAIANRLKRSDPLASPITTRTTTTSSTATATSSSTRTSPVSGAVLLSIVCPLTHETIKFRILQTQPFSLLLSEYIRKKKDQLNAYFTKHNMTEYLGNHKKLLEDDGFIVKFDGMPVKPNQTPQDLAMLEEETIQLAMPQPPTSWLGDLEKEVGFKLPERAVKSPPLTAQPPASAESDDEDGDFVIIRLRRDGVEEKFRIDRSNQFQRLHDSYCQKKQLIPEKVKFIFDGLPLNLKSTPEDQDMEDDDLVDVEVQPGAELPAARPAQSSASTPAPRKPMVELDDEGDYVILRVRRDSDEDKFRIKRNDPFKKLQEAYCKKKGLRMDSVKFTFDGLALKANQTPESQDMEDEDIIDVESP